MEGRVLVPHQNDVDEDTTLAAVGPEASDQSTTRAQPASHSFASWALAGFFLLITREYLTALFPETDEPAV
jgi:hypothetical protein